jgi:hypothetical protein
VSNFLGSLQPVAFDELPYIVDNEPDIPDQPDNPLRLNQKYVVYIQGYGPSSWSGWARENKPSLYDETYYIHPGVDYGDGNWFSRVVVSICDGIVIGGRTNGGSASPGRGVSIRCFMDSLETGTPDTDSDGYPNLSNIVVTYNHLGGNVNPQEPNYVDCDLINMPNCGSRYELPRIGDVVRIGDPLGQTGGDPSFDHLHLEVWFARGYLRPSSGPDNSLDINPILMFSTSLLAQHNFQFYFPNPLPKNPITDSLGIADNELSKWSVGAFNIASATSYSFYAAQIPANSGIEWPFDMAPLVPVNQLNYTELMEYLPQLFATYPYQPVNCIISIDTSRSPAREIAVCDLSDLVDNSSYFSINHIN